MLLGINLDYLGIATTLVLTLASDESD